jgi:hypothetical protein
MWGNEGFEDVILFLCYGKLIMVGHSPLRSMMDYGKAMDWLQSIYVDMEENDNIFDLPFVLDK